MLIVIVRSLRTIVFCIIKISIIKLLKLYLFTLTPSAIADFQGGRDNKKKTIYIMQMKTVKLKYDVRID